MNLFKKIIFLFRKPLVICVLGKDYSVTKKIISELLSKKNFDFEIIGSELINKEVFREIEFMLKKSRFCILVINRFESEKETIWIKDLIMAIPSRGVLVFNFDNEQNKEIIKSIHIPFLTYGFYKKSDLQATDLNIDINTKEEKNNDETNFKVNYLGSIVPFWIKNISLKEEIYNILAAIAVGIVLDMNLVEISQKIKALKIKE